MTSHHMTYDIWHQCPGLSPGQTGFVSPPLSASRALTEPLRNNGPGTATFCVHTHTHARAHEVIADRDYCFLCYPDRYPALQIRKIVRTNILILLATPAGFEPATFSLEGCCSIP